MRKIINLTTILLFITACGSNKNIDTASPCYYKNINKDSLTIIGFINEFQDQINPGNLRISNDSYQIFYYAGSYGGSAKNDYALILILDKERSFINKIDGEKQIVYTNKKVSKNSSAQAAISIQNLFKSEDKFIERNCLIEGGSLGILVILKGNSEKIEFYYNSDGYECDKTSENDRMKNAAEFVKLLKSI